MVNPFQARLSRHQGILRSLLALTCQLGTPSAGEGLRRARLTPPAQDPVRTSLGSLVSHSHTQTSETHTKRPGWQRLFPSLRQPRFRAHSHGVRPRNTAFPFLRLLPLLTAVLREAEVSAQTPPWRVGAPRGCSCLPSQPARPCPTLSRAKSPSLPRAQGRSQGSTHQSPPHRRGPCLYHMLCGNQQTLFSARARE